MAQNDARRGRRFVASEAATPAKIAAKSPAAASRRQRYLVAKAAKAAPRPPAALVAPIAPVPRKIYVRFRTKRPVMNRDRLRTRAYDRLRDVDGQAEPLEVTAAEAQTDPVEVESCTSCAHYIRIEQLERERRIRAEGEVSDLRDDLSEALRGNRRRQ